MYLCSLASSSSGNCVYIGSDNAHFIIDAGISGKRIEQGLNSIGFKTSDMDGILVTHEHTDHIKGIGVLSRKYGLPIYTTKKTAEAILNCKSLGKLPDGLIHIIESNKDINIKDLTIHPYQIPHDAIDPICYTVCDRNKKIGLATDLGDYNEYILDKLIDSNILFVEANHDINMLQVGSYPYYLKQRILGQNGHLSNERSGQLISKLIHDKLQHIVLGHLSKENNFEELAYETVQFEINKSNPCKNELDILVASRNKNSKLIAV
ncbi:MAG: MBL fold metallo-hydrolase [bacterium]